MSPFAPYFLFLGFLASVAQFILLREAASLALGNELAYVLVLFLWLLGTSVGSLTGQGIMERSPFLSRRFDWLAAAAVLLLPAGIVVLRLLCRAETMVGQIPSLKTLLLYLPLVVLPTSFFIGFLFPAGVRRFMKNRDKGHEMVSRAYRWEVLGFALGGAAFFLLLVRIGAFAAVLTLLAAAVLLVSVFQRPVRPRLADGLFFLAIGIAALTLFSHRLDIATLSGRFPEQRILSAVSTPYQDIVLTESGGQKNFYLSGVYAGSSGNEQSAEDLVHLSFANRGSIERVLVIGGGISGVLNEVLKYPVEQVVYSELDPRLIGVAKDFLPELSARFGDSRISLVYSDGRKYLTETDDVFDAIVLSAPDPLNLNLNRFYTEEFYALAASHLAKDGLFVTAVPYAPNAPQGLQKQMGRVIYRTLQTQFRHVIILPEETLVFISSGASLDYDPAPKAARFENLRLPVKYFSTEYLRYRYTTDRIVESLVEFKKDAAINSDLMPSLFYLKNLQWAALYDAAAAGSAWRAGLAVSRFKWPAAAALTALFLLPYLLRRRKAGLYPYLMSAVSGAGFLFQILLIYFFQTAFGYVYQEIIVITTALMLGLAAGNLLFSHRQSSLLRLGPAAAVGPLAALALAFAAYALNLPFSRVAAWLFALLLGLIQGLAFALFNALYQKKVPRAGTGLGRIYGADLFGACLAAPLGFFLIPLWGVGSVMTVLAAASISLLLVSGFRRRRSGKP